MASIGHIALGVAASRHTGKRNVYALLILSTISYLPDLDVIGYWLGIPYEAPFGHRGATHSLFVALILGTVFGFVGRIFQVSFRRFAVISIVLLASHGILDAMTTGGLGIEFFWPFSTARYFLPIRFIPVSKMGLHFWDPYQLRVFAIELVLFLPFFIYGLWKKT